MVNLWTDQQLELFWLDIFKRRYSLLSDMAFKITLAPPAALITTPAAADATDVVGNLGADGAATWALPMAEGNARSSIIRRHVAGSVGPAEPKDGEMMESWVLASDTNFGKPMHLSAHSYYGLPIDVGTPGFRAGGALPVELSHFRPERRIRYWCGGDYVVDAIGVEQRWILYQAESATRWRIQSRQCDDDSWRGYNE